MLMQPGVFVRVGVLVRVGVRVNVGVAKGKPTRSTSVVSEMLGLLDESRPPTATRSPLTLVPARAERGTLRFGPLLQLLLTGSYIWVRARLPNTQSNPPFSALPALATPVGRGARVVQTLVAMLYS